MMFSIKNKAISLLLCAAFVLAVIFEKKSLFAVEHPKIYYRDPKHFACADMTARRYSRQDPIYYYSIHFCNTYGIGNNYTYHFYFYELLTNVYKPSFVEIHAKACVLVKKDPVFGAIILRAMRSVYKNSSCPLPPGSWSISNVTLDAAALPNFPFQRGRIYLNITFNPTDELALGAYVDFQIKEMKVKKNTLLIYRM